MSLRAQTPETCPDCGYDPTGDDDEFVSGGGWEHDNFITDDVWTEQLRCHRCGCVVAEIEQSMGGERL